MSTNHPQRNQLFVASCLALLVTSLSFGIRAGILGRLGVQFGLSTEELGTIAATAFWGFPLAVIIGGFVVDVIGMKRLLIVAFIFHLAGIVLTDFRRRILDAVHFHFNDRHRQWYG
jgi:MFS family permease